MFHKIQLLLDDVVVIYSTESVGIIVAQVPRFPFDDCSTECQVSNNGCVMQN